MMQSRHNTFGFWLFTIGAIFFFLLVVSTISQYYFDTIIIKIELRDTKDLFWQITLALVGLLIMISILWCNVKIIIIENYNKTISIKNLFIRTTKVYNFQELDGYIDTIVRHGRGFTSYKSLALIKDKKIIRKIDSFYYSNVHEMQTELKELKYLGFVKLDLIKSIKTIFNYPILE